MRYFLFVSLFLLSCSPPYKHLTTTPAAKRGQEISAPEFQTALYSCSVEGKFLFKRFNLSGLLYFKNFSDTATRVIFQTQMGLTYFDFGWDKSDQFKVFSIIEQMDRNALIQTLKKDFELLLFKNIKTDEPAYFVGAGGEDIIRFALDKKGFAYYFLNQEGELTGIKQGDGKKEVVQINFSQPATDNTLPDDMTIRHLRAGFSITLKKLQPHAVE